MNKANSSTTSAGKSSRIDERLIAELDFIRTRRAKLQKTNAIAASVPVIAKDIKASPGSADNVRFPNVDQDSFELVGLALSGGGLRSASVCVGALQGLNSVGVLDRIDYLSTVSGGGYTGGSYVATSHRTGGRFCFDKQQGRRPSSGATIVGDTPAVQHLRDHSNFLTPRGIGDLLQDVALVVRGLVTSAFVIAPYVIAAAVITILLYSLCSTAVPAGQQVLLAGQVSVAWLAMGGLVAGAFVIWSLFRADPSKSEFNGWLAPIFAGLLVVLAITAFLWFQHWLLQGMLSQANPPSAPRPAPPRRDFLTLLNAALLGSPVLALVIAFFRDQLIALAKSQGSKIRDILARHASRLMLLIGSVILPVVLWLIYLDIVEIGLARVLHLAKSESVYTLPHDIILDRTTVILAGIALIGFVIAEFIGDNAYSLHGLYRDRLRQAFLAMPISGGSSALATTKVDQLTAGFHPYPIFNTALNVQGSSAVNRRGRNADLFSFTPHFAGSPSTGYQATKDILKDGAGMDLATVMAISGAAAAANMGVNSYRPMAFTLAALNIRLGFWLRNPSLAARESIFSGFYLWNEMTSSLDETQSKILLTDGGHVENLGIYELLRRRCKLIVVIDAEADPDMRFGSFYQLERFARIDLGARITIDLGPIAAATRARMATNVDGDPKTPDKGPHAALGTIHYDGAGAGDRETGYLLYVKASLSGDEPDYVRDYARRNPGFPHESTADLFYSEEQFEAYRSLGFHMVRRALHFEDQLVLPGPDGTSYLEPLNTSKTARVPLAVRHLLGLMDQDADADPPPAERTHDQITTERSA